MITKPTKHSGSIDANTSFVRRISAQDAKTWRQFVRVFGPLIFQWGKKAGLSDEAAADVGQEVFRGVINGIQGFDHRGEDSLIRWLRRITQYKVADYWRSAEKTPKAMGGSTFQEVVNSVPQDSQLDSEEVDATERHAVLSQLITSLKSQFSPNAWSAFWETAVNGRTSSEVADDLEMSSMAVRKAKSRVLCKLRSELRNVVDLANWDEFLSTMSHGADKTIG